MSVWIVLFQAVVCRAVRWRMQFSGGAKFKERKRVACRKSHCMSVPAGTGLAKNKAGTSQLQKVVCGAIRASVGVHFHLADVDYVDVSHARYHERGITNLVESIRLLYVGQPVGLLPECVVKHVLPKCAVTWDLKKRCGFQYTDGSPGGRVLKRLCSQKYSAGRWRTQSSRWVFMRWVSACTSSVGKSLHGSLRCTV